MMRWKVSLNLLFSLWCLVPGCAGWAAVRVVNAGVPGESSREIASRLGAALDQYKPQFVVIFAGMNDAVNDRKFLQPQETAAYITTMVKDSQRAHAKVVLVNLHDPDERRLLERHTRASYGERSPAERIKAANEEIVKIAQRYGVALADFHEAFERSGGANDRLSTDGVHLAATGYGILASTVRQALPARIDQDSTVLCIGDSLTYGIGVRQPGVAPEGTESYPAQLESLLH